MNRLEFSPDEIQAMNEAVRRTVIAFDEFGKAVVETWITIRRSFDWSVYYEQWEKQKKTERYLKRYIRRGERMRRQK